MTAFILFVLATADVKGFAFTLGIGMIVSLFTAVLATQAILMTMGDSRMIARPSALGAGGKKHVWRFDFMGASRYFFSMSGVILLIGALAIGGRGLNLGIDFTSGTRITGRPVAAGDRGAGRPRSSTMPARTERPSSRRSGPRRSDDGFQISSKLLAPTGVTKVENALDTSFGIVVNGTDFNQLGRADVRHDGRQQRGDRDHRLAARDLAYVALRFEWKFAVPVLIALMHDLLITSGVYALTGREVTADTVAALLTILGYSLYDTIIVFDRVRENIPRMPRAAFSQIVNRSMSEVLTRSIATTSCTLLPIIALLLFGGSTLKDFAFALLIGVASGAYSSIFIASPVLTHWKEREPAYRARRHRIEGELGFVPAYAGARRRHRPGAPAHGRAGRTADRRPSPTSVSAAEFEQMKRRSREEQAEPSRHTSTLTKRLAHRERRRRRPVRGPTPRPRRAAQRRARSQRRLRSQRRRREPAAARSQPRARSGPSRSPTPVRPATATAPDRRRRGAARARTSPRTTASLRRRSRPGRRSQPRNRRHGRRR